MEEISGVTTATNRKRLESRCTLDNASGMPQTSGSCEAGCSIVKGGT